MNWSREMGRVGRSRRKSAVGGHPARLRSGALNASTCALGP